MKWDGQMLGLIWGTDIKCITQANEWISLEIVFSTRGWVNIKI